MQAVEAEIHPKAGDIVTRANRTTLTWKRHTTSKHINLNSFVGGSDNLTAYAFTLLHSDTVADICIRLTGDDGVRVVLNA